MATWVLTATGLPLSIAGANLVGNVALTGTKPADYNHAGVTSIAVSRTIRASAMGDDTWTDTQSMQLKNSAGQPWFTNNSGGVSGLVAGDRTITPTASQPPVYQPTDTGNYANGDASTLEWAVYNANMKSDLGVLAVVALTVTITYTPAVVIPDALIWNGTSWKGGVAWNGTRWVQPKVWNGTRWVPIAAPAGVAAPVASFTANRTLGGATGIIASGSSGNSPSRIIFTSTSTGDITSYLWEITSSGYVVMSGSLTGPGPIDLEFSGAGTHTVKLTVTGPGGSSQQTFTYSVTGPIGP